MLEVVAQGISALDPNGTIEAASKYGEAVFLVVVAMLVYGGIYLIKLKSIDQPRLDADLKKLEADVVNQSKIADGFKALTETTRDLKDLLKLLASCIEGIQETLASHEDHHNTTHKSLDKLFHSMECAIDAFKHRAHTQEERTAIVRIEEAIQNARSALNHVH